MILFFGPTGAGKSLQGQIMAIRQGWKWLSTGEMFRASKDPQIIAQLKTGELLSDEQTYELFQNAVQEAHEKHYPQIIVDGFPRNKSQAEWLARYMDEAGEKIDIVIALEVPESEIMKRLEKRARMEDSPEVIARRMNIYRQKMYPVLGTFAEGGVRVVHVEGIGTAGEVHDKLYAELAANRLV